MGKIALLLTVIVLLSCGVYAQEGEQEVPLMAPTTTPTQGEEAGIPVIGSPEPAPTRATETKRKKEEAKTATKPLAPPPSYQPQKVDDPVTGFNLSLPPAKATPPTSTTAPTPQPTVKVVKEVRESDLPKVIETLRGEGASYVGVYSDGRGHSQVKAYFTPRPTPTTATPQPAEQPVGNGWLFALMAGAAIIVFLLSLVWIASQR